MTASQTASGIEPRCLPISFSAPLVLRVMDGSKWQTRRAIKFNPRDIMCPECGPGDVSKAWADPTSPIAGPCVKVPCACGCYQRVGARWSKGDRLWVKEPLYRDPQGLVAYASDDEVAAHGTQWKWKPRKLGAMYCPRWASRIDLEIAEVRVQRVQAISEEDARAEGVDPMVVLPGDAVSWAAPFAHLWDHINGKRPGCAWDANPWVWAVSFRRVRP